MPLTPTMLLMPSAIPRWWTGKASVPSPGIGEQTRLADTLHDTEYDQVVRAGSPVIQSIASSNEAIV